MIFCSLIHQIVNDLLLVIAHAVKHVESLFTQLTGCAARCCSKHGFDNLFLFVVEAIKDVTNRLRFRSRLFRFFFGLIISMLQLVAGVNNSLVIRTIPVAHDAVNEGPRVSPGQHQAHLSNSAVEHIAALLLQPVGVDAQGGHVSIVYQLFGRLAAFILVEGAVGIHAFFSVLQQGMPQHVVGVIVLVVPHQGHCLPIIVLERIPQDGSSI